jgi:hypothetical protein
MEPARPSHRLSVHRQWYSCDPRLTLAFDGGPTRPSQQVGVLGFSECQGEIMHGCLHLVVCVLRCNGLVGRAGLTRLSNRKLLFQHGLGSK